VSGDGGMHPPRSAPRFYPNGRERVLWPRPGAAAARRLAVVASAWPRLPGAAVQRHRRPAAHDLPAPSSVPITPPSYSCIPTDCLPASGARPAGPTRARSPAASRPATASAPPLTVSASPAEPRASSVLPQPPPRRISGNIQPRRHHKKIRQSLLIFGYEYELYEPTARARPRKPKPVSPQRRRATAESRPSPDNAGGFVRRRRIESDCRKPEGHRCPDAPRCGCRQLEPHHLVSHLIMKLNIRKTSLSWSPVAEPNRRSSPYHGHPIIRRPATA